jgi:hypothetical protein
MAGHKDLEYHVDFTNGQAQTKVCDDPNEAAGLAVALCLSRGESVTLDVICWSRAAAVAYRGSEDGGVEYDEDPEASVFERIVITATSQGRVA